VIINIPAATIIITAKSWTIRLLPKGEVDDIDGDEEEPNVSESN
jgi:hypothetical protein